MAYAQVIKGSRSNTKEDVQNLLYREDMVVSKCNDLVLTLCIPIIASTGRYGLQ